MNATVAEREWQTVLGRGVRMDELGCDELWFDRQRCAEKAGKPWCEHCGRAVDMDTAWVVRTAQQSAGGVLVAIPHDLPLSQTNERWVLFGSTCGPKFIGDRSLLVAASATPTV